MTLAMAAGVTDRFWEAKTLPSWWKTLRPSRASAGRTKSEPPLEAVLQKIHIHNPGPKPLEVMLEVNPDRYVLQSGDKLEIEADLGGAPVDVTPYENGITIFAGNAYEPIVRINGVIVEPDWN